MRDWHIGTVLKSALVLTAACSLGGRVQAEDLPTFPIRSLIIRASEIVLAEPLDPTRMEGKSWQFKVIKVLKGGRIREGENIEVGGTELYRLGKPGWMRDEKGGKPPKVTRALLFLEPAHDTKPEEKAFDLSISGVRCLTAGGAVLYPSQFMNPGGYYLVPEKGASWDELVARVAADVPKVAEVFSLRNIEDLAARNQAIFRWIEKHHDEFTGSIYNRPKGKPGWGSLERDTFGWILESCRAEDAWRALQLFDEIAEDSGYGPDGNVPTFASPEGRRLLLGIVTDPKQPEKDRQRALCHLSRSFWPRHHRRREFPHLANITPQEQAEIIEKTAPFLKSKEAEFRRLAVRALACASSARDGNLKHRDTRAALPLLIEAYRREPPGSVRNQLAETVRDLSGEQTWQEVSGNSDRMLVVLYSFGMNSNYGWEKISFNMNMSLLGGKIRGIYRQPTLIVERLDQNAEVVQRKTMPLPVSYPKNIWVKGWTNQVISVEVPSAGMAEGTWRFVVEGVAGKDRRTKWRSEPGLFRLKREQPIR